MRSFPKGRGKATEVSLKSECWLGRMQLGVDYKCDSWEDLPDL